MSLAVGHDHLELEGVRLEKIPPSIGWATGQLGPFSLTVTGGNVHEIQCATKRSRDTGVTESVARASIFGGFADRGSRVAHEPPRPFAKSFVPDAGALVVFAENSGSAVLLFTDELIDRAHGLGCRFRVTS
jgi:hypothetical protein